MSPGAGPTHLLYLHGFRSSPRSFKAVLLQQWLQAHRPDVHLWCPQLPVAPDDALALAEHELARWPAGRLAVIGSSLGGFYATCLAERHGCPALLLNPAIDPARDLARHVGRHSAWHDPGQTLDFDQAHLAQLRALMPGPITRPERYGAIIAQGDEVLDWREMVARYPGAHIRLLPGSDHGISDFADHLPFLLHFLNLLP